MANGKIQIRDGAANALYPRVRTTDIMNGDVNISIFDENDVIRPQFIPGSVDEILPFTSTVTGTTVPAVEQDSAAHYINTTSKTIYGTMFNGTSYVWAPAQNLTGAALYTSGGKLYRWTGTAMAVIDQAIASTTTVRTTGAVNTLVPTEAAVATAIANAVTAGNTNLVSSVKGANGLTQNGSTGNIIISGIDAKGDSSTKGVVITTSAITSNAGGNSNVVPTMNAIYTALAGKQAAGNYATSAQLSAASAALNTAIGTKAAANHNHDTVYAPIAHSHAVADITDFAANVISAQQSTVVAPGANVTVTSSVEGNVITYAVSGQKNTNLVSSVSGTNGLTQNAITGKVIISGVNATGTSTGVGVVATLNAITSGVAGGTSFVVPTMQAVWNMSSTLNAKADNDHITSVVSGNAGIKVTSTINGTTVTYQVSNLVTNTNLVSSVTGYNGLSANPTTGVVKVSGVDTTGNGTTKGVVATTKTITSVATSGDTFVTPTVNAVWVSCLFYTAID